MYSSKPKSVSGYVAFYRFSAFHKECIGGHVRGPFVRYYVKVVKIIQKPGLYNANSIFISPALLELICLFDDIQTNNSDIKKFELSINIG